MKTTGRCILLFVAWLCAVPAVALAGKDSPAPQFPLGIAPAADGGIYFSERRGHQVRHWSAATGVLRVIAGTGESGFSGDGGPAVDAQLSCPDSIDTDAAGNLYIADRCNERIRRVDAKTGVISTVAGNGERGPGEDGQATEVALTGPYYVRVHDAETILFTDTDSHRVRELDLAAGRVVTLAGSGEAGFSGDGGPALAARLQRPHVVFRARNGDLIIGDSMNQRIRRVDASTGNVRTIAGNGEEGAAVDAAFALDSPFFYFGEILERPDGALVFTEWWTGRLIRLDPATGKLHVLAGNADESASVADGSPATSVRIGPTADFIVDTEGRYVVAAARADAIRRIDPKRDTITTLLGTPSLD